jgi:hypothetical protein
MKTQMESQWMQEPIAHPAAGKTGKNGSRKKKSQHPHISGIISPDSYHIRGVARTAGYLRQTPAP